MQILKNLKNPIIWIIGLTIKTLIRKLFFNNLENNDFKRLFSYTLDLLPHETFINIIKLLINTFKSKPSELFNFNIFNEAINHSIPSEQRNEVVGRVKYWFIFLILGNIFKRTIFLIKNIIILPFKLGVYGFIAFLFGIKVDYFLSFFDYLKFNIPSWTYNKLLELHLSWLNWFKNILQINSITTDIDKTPSLPRLKIPYITNTTESEIVELESKPETYLYLTKRQWLYLSISCITALAVYFGYTGGIPFKKFFEWESGANNSGSDSSSNQGTYPDYENRGEGSSRGPTHSFPVRSRRGNDTLHDHDNVNTWQDTFTIWTTNVLEKIKNPFNLRRNNLETEDLEVERDVEKISYFKRLQDKLWNEPNDPLTQGQSEREKKRSFLANFWKSHDEIANIKVEQLERQGHLSELDRAELRKEYLQSKDNSPTLSDQETSREYDHLFPKLETYTQPNVSIPRASFYSKDYNDSTDT